MNIILSNENNVTNGPNEKNFDSHLIIYTYHESYITSYCKYNVMNNVTKIDE